MKYQIKDTAGKVIYINLVRTGNFPGYVWPDCGHITDSLIKFEKWTVEAMT
jgi:hypothetical protein